MATIYHGEWRTRVLSVLTLVSKSSVSRRTTVRFRQKFWGTRLKLTSSVELNAVSLREPDCIRACRRWKLLSKSLSLDSVVGCNVALLGALLDGEDWNRSY